MPRGVANMKKWGQILSQADTADPDYLKNRGRQAAADGASSSQDGASIFIVAAVALLGIVAAVVLKG